MLTIRRIDAFFLQSQPLHRNPTGNVRFNDLGHVVGTNSPVPDLIRINDHVRSVLALVQTTGFVGANCCLQTARRYRVLERALQFGIAGRIAAGSGASWLSPIGTNEDMVLEFSHLSKPSKAAPPHRFRVSSEFAATGGRFYAH